MKKRVIFSILVLFWANFGYCMNNYQQIQTSTESSQSSENLNAIINLSEFDPEVGLTQLQRDDLLCSKCS